MYTVKKMRLIGKPGIFSVEKILYRCGKNMAKKYDLHHWDNNHFKNLIILALCVLKNEIFVVLDADKKAVATFQVSKNGQALHFCKLATDPSSEGKGIGSFCMQSIEEMATQKQCRKVCLEVYEQSNHAIEFYKRRGYEVCGRVQTLKYTELQMEKPLGN